MDRNVEGERLETGRGRVRPLGATMLARNLGTRVAAGASPRPAYSDQATPPPPLGGVPPSTRPGGGGGGGFRRKAKREH